MPRCELCDREVSRTTKHHLIPKTRHTNKRVRRDYSREALRQTAALCAPCHRTIHSVFSEKTLQCEMSTLAKMKDHPDVARFLKWIGRRPNLEIIPVRGGG